MHGFHARCNTWVGVNSNTVIVPAGSFVGIPTSLGVKGRHGLVTNKSGPLLEGCPGSAWSDRPRQRERGFLL